MEIKFPKTYCVFDFETSGLDPAKDKIIEIGAMRVSEGVEPETFSCLINWGIPIPENIQEITKISQAMIDAEGVDPEKAFHDFYNFLRVENGSLAPLVGHNILKFDIPFLLATGMFDSWNGYEIDRNIWNNCIDTAAIYKAGKIPIDYQWNDTHCSYANRALEMRVKGLKFNVGVVCDELGIERGGLEQHRALADVLLTNEIYKKLCLI